MVWLMLDKLFVPFPPVLLDDDPCKTLLLSIALCWLELGLVGGWLGTKRGEDISGLDGRGG